MENPNPENHQAPAAPPAAKIVTTGTKTEREIALESELETEKASHAKTAGEKKQRETRICELEDELHRSRAPRPPAQDKKSSLIDDLNEFFGE